MIAVGTASMGRAATPTPGAQSSRWPRAVVRLRLVLRAAPAAESSGGSSGTWMSCFRPAPSPATAAAAGAVKEAKGKRPEVEKEPARGGGEDVWSAEAEEELSQGGAFPEHLVVMVNGLVGRWIRVPYCFYWGSDEVGTVSEILSVFRYAVQMIGSSRQSSS